MIDEDLVGAVRLEPGKDFDRCVIGKADSVEGSVFVYSYEKIVKAVAESFGDGLSESDWLDALEYVDYNTIRAIEYMGNRRPLVVYDIQEGVKGE